MLHQIDISSIIYSKKIITITDQIFVVQKLSKKT